MPVPEQSVEYTPVRARTSKLVHATTLATPNVTACGKKYRGWVIAVNPLTCPDCRRAIFMPVGKTKERVR